MKRVAQTIRLRPERREEYLALHAAVWPDAGTGGHWSGLPEIWHLGEEERA